MKKSTAAVTATAMPATPLPEVKSIDQNSFAHMIAKKYNLKLSDVMAVIVEEQKLTMEYAKMGYRIVKKNYLTIESKPIEGKKDWKCPLNGKTYNLAPSFRVNVRVGIGFKRYLSDKKMPDNLCRFVSGSNEKK